MTHEPAPARAIKPAVWAALTVVYVIWGSTYFGIRVLVGTIPPLLGAGVRFLAASAILAAALAIWAGPRTLLVPRRRLTGPLLVGLLLLTFGNGMVGVAERHISSGLAALLVASVPLWLVTFRRFAGDRPPPATVAGVLVGFAGLVLLTLSQGSAGGTGALGVAVVLGAALSWASGSFFASRLPMPADPFVATVYEMLFGGIALLALGLGRGEARNFALGQVSAASGWALGYLVVFGSLLAFTSYVWLLGNAPISLVGTYAYVNPAVAVLLGVSLLGEPLTWPIMLGGGIIVAGVGLVVSTERRTPAARRAGTAARAGAGAGVRAAAGGTGRAGGSGRTAAADGTGHPRGAEVARRTAGTPEAAAVSAAADSSAPPPERRRSPRPRRS